LVSRELGIVARRWRQLGIEERGHLARNAVDGKEVWPVRRDLELENGVGEREDIREGRTRLEGIGEDEDAGVVLAQLELALGEDHPVGELPPKFRLLETVAVGEHGAGQR